MTPRFVQCAISDRNILTDSGIDALADQAGRLAAEGVEFFQLREKDLGGGDLALLARLIMARLRGTTTRLLVNSRADVAVATGAHGVHLTAHPGQLTPTQVRALYTQACLPHPSVTVSCHTLDDIARQLPHHPTAILFGPVFGKLMAGEQVSGGTGLGLLEQACLAADAVPILALGGVTPENAAVCLAAGARGIAGIRLFA